MIVVDTNVISYLLLPTPFSDSADALFKADSDWLAPTLWKSEFRNVLALYIRKEILTLEEALPIQEEAESMMAQNEYEVSSSQILALVKESHCSAYDCEFIALAQQLQIPLITEDKKVLNEFPTIALSITEFLQQPR